MAVRPRCCPCGSPIYTKREASPEWMFTHADCVRTVRRYSSTNTRRTHICRPSPLYALSSHRLQFTDSDSDYFTNMPAHSMRPSQLYQKKSARKGPSNPPLSVRNLNVGNDKCGTKTGKHDLALQLLIIVDGPRTAFGCSNSDWDTRTSWISADSGPYWGSGTHEETDAHCEK